MTTSTGNTHGRQFSTRMSETVREQLLQAQDECTFIWGTAQDASGTIMSFLWSGGHVWLTTNDQRPRIAAVQKTGRATVVVSSAGTQLGRSRCITLRGQCDIVNDRATAAWFYPAFCQKLFPGQQAAQQAMHALLDREGQVILRLQPDKIIAYDGDALMQRLAAL